MSTTTKLEVAIKYAASRSSVLLKLNTSSFMQRGADLSYLSCFPTESEILFPPLTFLEPVATRPVEVVVADKDAVTDSGQVVAPSSAAEKSAMFIVVECVPHFGT